MLDHRNPLWRYRDARGVERLGHFHGSWDLGGTDVGLFAYDCQTGEMTVISGQRYRDAVRIWAPCAHDPRVNARAPAPTGADRKWTLNPDEREPS